MCDVAIAVERAVQHATASAAASSTTAIVVPCQVCGSPRSSGFHCGAITCEACKAFFHRSAIRHILKIEEDSETGSIRYSNGYSCIGESSLNQCDISEPVKLKCQHCRLERCLAVGMVLQGSSMGRPSKAKLAELTAQLGLATGDGECLSRLPIGNPRGRGPRNASGDLMQRAPRKRKSSLSMTLVDRSTSPKQHQFRDQQNFGPFRELAAIDAAKESPGFAPPLQLSPPAGFPMSQPILGGNPWLQTLESSTHSLLACNNAFSAAFHSLAVSKVSLEDQSAQLLSWYSNFLQMAFLAASGKQTVDDVKPVMLQQFAATAPTLNPLLSAAQPGAFAPGIFNFNQSAFVPARAMSTTTGSSGSVLSD